MVAFARFSLLTALVAGTMSVLAAQASAGGAPLNFDQRFYAPGEVAKGHVSFGPGSVGLEGINEGPFFAYLMPDDRWIEPHRIPRGAIRVGEIGFAPLEGNEFEATLSFVVPDIPHGAYRIDYCNSPCELASVGELWGGGIAVYGSGTELRLERLLTAAEHRASHLRSRLERAERKLEAVEGDLEQQVSAQRGLSQRLQAELDAARSAAEAPSTPFGLIGWLLFAATALLWAGRSLTRARRRPPPDHPGIPERERIEPARELEPVH